MLKIISLIFNFIFLLGMAVFCFPATAVKAYELKDETRGLGVPDVVAKVNGVELKSKIIKFQFNRTMRDMDRKVDARGKKKLIQMLIDKEVVRELIHHEGKRKNLVIAQEDINKELEKMRTAYGYKSNDELAKALKERDIAL
ncbi:MAG: SurA N-terminal domain-containing protein, partial [Nitrospinae bacterium]|nr:SurA N-terminal domain-containing protein [Nitrospinota bacterium]